MNPLLATQAAGVLYLWGTRRASESNGLRNRRALHAGPRTREVPLADRWRGNLPGRHAP